MKLFIVFLMLILFLGCNESGRPPPVMTADVDVPAAPQMQQQKLSPVQRQMKLASSFSDESVDASSLRHSHTGQTYEMGGGNAVLDAFLVDFTT